MQLPHEACQVITTQARNEEERAKSGSAVFLTVKYTQNIAVLSLYHVTSFPCAPELTRLRWAPSGQLTSLDGTYRPWCRQ